MPEDRIKKVQILTRELGGVAVNHHCVVGLGCLAMLAFSSCETEESTSQGPIYLLSVKTKQGSAYRIGGMARYRFRDWIAASDIPANVSENELATELEYVVDVYTEETGFVKKYEFRISAADPTTCYFRVQSEVRQGNVEELKAIIDEPSLLPTENVQRLGKSFYYSSMRDDQIDKKEQWLNTGSELIWMDSDRDGFFDRGFLRNVNNGQERSEAKIRVPVPKH